MGWEFFPGTTRDDVVRLITEEHGRGRVRAVRHEEVDGVLWVAHEIIESAERWIGCYPLQMLCVGGDVGWGFRPMSESEHPPIYTCPTILLDIVSDDEPSAEAGWRERVRAHVRVAGT